MKYNTKESTIKVDWYFDFISPFAYLQWAHQLPRLENVELELKPLLFAGLLKHWGHKGPAEIPGKRRFVYRQTLWMAQRLEVPLRIPNSHPFNPLPLLRLSLARHNDRDIVDRLFAFVWRDGCVPQDPRAWRRLCNDLDVTDAELADPAVKQRLLDNGEEAIAKGVFGVPTLVTGGEPFWGVDAFDFFVDYLDNP
ncbi:MAG: 2-hydroxychromene-2-carboxylate isomerase, partial [Salinisphaera sp.]|nr:2-hydroxychromene-2-carboxylate isomerase [Salinisphaera sp.]